VDFEPNDDFERELHQALQRRPAPPGLKLRLMERRRSQRPLQLSVVWQRLAASLVVAGAVAGGFAWRNREELRRAENARQQVMIALRITGHALNKMNAQLAAHNRSAQQ
jgi:hypothetical protein